jgi:ankyrin repeat protein
VDDKGFNLLHHAVLKGLVGKVGVLIELFKEGADEQNISYADQLLTTWINGRTHSDKFTALHFASFRGSMNAIETLINHGADVHATNQFGLNMLHVAA